MWLGIARCQHQFVGKNPERYTCEDKVDIGYKVHERVHKDYGIELVTRFNDVTLVNTIIVLKVQTPALVGGTEDHYTWNQRVYENRKHPKYKSYLEYKKMMQTSR